MLNIGPRGDGSVPQRAVDSLRASGEWIRRYPQVVYGTDASPWKRELPWGDVTVKGNKLFLSVFEWPAGGSLYLPGLKNKIKSARLLKGKEHEVVAHTALPGWTRFTLPATAPEKLVSVIEVELDGTPDVDPGFALDPTMTTRILAEFAAINGAKRDSRRWMEKFGEWKHMIQINEWQDGGKATWEVDVLVPGDYHVDLTYAGQDRLVWKVEVEGGQAIQNQQNASHNYQSFPIGWLNFPKAGRYKVSASCIEGETKSAALSAIQFTPLQ